MEIKQELHAGFQGLSSRHQARQEGITRVVHNVSQRLLKACMAQGLPPIGFVNITLSFDRASTEADFLLVMLTQAPAQPTVDDDLFFEPFAFPAGKALVIDLHGSYDGIPAAFQALAQHAASSGLALKPETGRTFYASAPGEPLWVRVMWDVI